MKKIDLEELKRVRFFAQDLHLLKRGQSRINDYDPIERQAAYNEIHTAFLEGALKNWEAMIKEIETLRGAVKEAEDLLTYISSGDEVHKWLEKYAKEGEECDVCGKLKKSSVCYAE